MPDEYVTGQARRNAYARLPEKNWLESSLVRSWLINDPELMANLLRSPDMELPGLEELVAHIERRIGRKLASLRRAGELIPIMKAGEDHAKLRRGLAVYLAARVSEAPAILPGLLKPFLQPLEKSGVVDLHHDVASPLVRAFMSFLVGAPVPQEILDLRLDLILTNRKSPSFVIALDERFAKGLAYAQAIARDEMDLACKLCCLTFGAETLVMMLMESMLAAITDAGGGPALLPAYPLETGVPLTWRAAARDQSLGGCDIKAGDTVKIKLQAAGYSEQSAHRQLIFGAGLHSCVGKQVSLVLWEHFANGFNALNLRARIKQIDAAVEPYMIRYNRSEVEIP